MALLVPIISLLTRHSAYLSRSQVSVLGRRDREGGRGGGREREARRVCVFMSRGKSEEETVIQEKKREREK